MLKKLESDAKLRSAHQIVEDDEPAFTLTQIEDAELNNAKYQSNVLLPTAIRLLKEQFCQYLFAKTTADGNRLYFCWFNAYDRRRRIGFGYHQPSSPQELLAMFTHIKEHIFIDRCDLNHTLINEALNTSNSLILDDCELTTIFDEYLASADLNLICNHWPI